MGKTLFIVLFVIVIIAVAVIAIRAMARKKISANLAPFVLAAGSTRPYFEENGVKYDTEKYETYLANYVKNIPQAQLAGLLQQRSNRTDIWNTKMCAAMKNELSRRAEQADADDASDDTSDQ